MKPIKIILFFSILISLGSCSIEKRRYMPGYSITWKTEKFQSESISAKDSSISNYPITSYNDSLENYPISTSRDSSLFFHNPINSNSIIAQIAEKDSPFFNNQHKIQQNKKKEIDVEKESKESLFFAVLAFCLFLLGIGLHIMMLGWYNISFILFIFASCCLLGALVLAVLGLIKSIKTLNYLRKNPEEKKKNKKRAIAGLLINPITLFLMLLLLLFYISTASNY
jgi:hypothetical protein